jgi:hypothetical protein
LRLAKFSHPQSCPKAVLLANLRIVTSTLATVIRVDLKPIFGFSPLDDKRFRIPEEPHFFIKTLAFLLASRFGAVALLVIDVSVGSEQLVATQAPAFSFFHRSILL